MMKKIMMLLFVFVLLFPLSADTGTVYTGDGNVFPSDEVSLPLVMKTDDVLSSSKVFFGFYTGEGDVEYSSDDDEYQIVFQEKMVPSTSTKVTYQASANFKLYVYILSTEKMKLSLKWTALYYRYKDSSSGSDWSFFGGMFGGNSSSYLYSTIPVSVVNVSTKASEVYNISSATDYTILTFDPSNGVLYHKDFEFNATTNTYTASDLKTTTQNYTGTMRLTLTTTT
jgi:hypothetical protein